MQNALGFSLGRPEQLQYATRPLQRRALHGKPDIRVAGSITWALALERQSKTGRGAAGRKPAGLVLDPATKQRPNDSKPGLIAATPQDACRSRSAASGARHERRASSSCEAKPSPSSAKNTQPPSGKPAVWPRKWPDVFRNCLRIRRALPEPCFASTTRTSIASRRLLPHGALVAGPALAVVPATEPFRRELVSAGVHSQPLKASTPPGRRKSTTGLQAVLRLSDQGQQLKLMPNLALERCAILHGRRDGSDRRSRPRKHATICSDGGERVEPQLHRHRGGRARKPLITSPPSGGVSCSNQLQRGGWDRRFNRAEVSLERFDRVGFGGFEGTHRADRNRRGGEQAAGRTRDKGLTTSF